MKLTPAEKKIQEFIKDWRRGECDLFDNLDKIELYQSARIMIRKGWVKNEPKA